MTIILLVDILVIVGLVLSTVQAILTGRMLRSARHRGPESATSHSANGVDPTAHFSNGQASPHVSILKPIAGLDDGLEENLLSFANLTGVAYEVIISVADGNDPALTVARRVVAAFPDGPFSIVVGDAGGLSKSDDSNEHMVLNPKVRRLIAAAREARGEILMVSDSNIRIAPGDLAETVSAFEDPKVGLVWNPFLVHGARSLGALIESLYILTFALPGSVLAAATRVTCVVGKSMALSRDAYEAIGGIEAFGNVLAEDQAVGLAVRKAGYDVALRRPFVKNVIVRKSLREALDRQVRWNKIRYSFSRLLYTTEFIASPLPLAVLAAFAAAILQPESLFAPAVIAAVALAVRLAQSANLIAATGERALPLLFLVPVQDFLQFGVKFGPYISNRVVWRGHEAFLGRGSIMFLPLTTSARLSLPQLRRPLWPGDPLPPQAIPSHRKRMAISATHYRER